MLALKHDFATYTRSTDAKISLLKEVIEKVGRGEKVDVEKMLGTGDEAKEREWEEGLSYLSFTLRCCLGEVDWLILVPCSTP